MHELAISSAIVDTAARHAGGRRVEVVTLRLGSLRQVVAESLCFYFEIVARDGLCAGAELEIEHVGAWMRCMSCAHEWDPAPPAAATHERAIGDPASLMALPVFRCPACAAAGAEVVRGDELEVESIEVSNRQAESKEEQQCIAPR
jgi:hydrogenase nickel incorporation protein HypA/HybF